MSTPALVVAEQVSGYELRLLTPELDGPVSSVALRSGPDGQAVVAWRQHAEALGGVYVSSRSAPDRWTVPRPGVDRLSFAPDAGQPAVAIGRGGHVVAAWNQNSDDIQSAQIATRREGADRFRRPAGPQDALSLPINFVNDPRPAVNSHGDAVVVWSQSDGGALRVWVSERYGADGPFSKPASGEQLSVDTPGPEGGLYFVDEAVVDIADSGAAFVVWEQPFSEEGTALAAAYRDTQGAWHGPVDETDSFTPQQGASRRPQVHFARSGELFVVWYHDGGETRSVRLAQTDPTGNWIHSGGSPIELSSASFATDPRIAVGEDGGVLVVWLEVDGSDTMVKARRSHVEALGVWEPTETLWTSQPEEPVYGLSVDVGASHDHVLVGFIESGEVYFATY